MSMTHDSSFLIEWWHICKPDHISETFPSLRHIFVVGVGGAVPHLSDYRSHVRLGDIVVSMPHKPGGPIYNYCDKALLRPDSLSHKFMHTSWTCADDTISSTVSQLKSVHERDTYSSSRPWERQIEAAIEALSGEESSSSRPPAKTDKLYAVLDGEGGTPVLIEHPKPLGTRENKYYRENKPNIRYGPVASSKCVARNMKLRMDFAESCHCMVYDADSRPTMEVLKRHNKDSFVIIRGTADYSDGHSNLDWQPYAAVCAAAYAKYIILSMPGEGQRIGGYFPPR